jgi:hypothetical protein
MREKWVGDARVGVPMMQMVAKQVSQCAGGPRAVRQIIDQQWLDEESKQELRETYQVTDADLLRHEREAALEARRRTRERYGTPAPVRETFRVTGADLAARQEGDPAGPASDHTPAA